MSLIGVRDREVEQSLQAYADVCLEVHQSVNSFLGAESRQEGLVLCALVKAEETRDTARGHTLKSISERIDLSTTQTETYLKKLEDDGKIIRMPGSGRVAASYYLEPNYVKRWYQSDEAQKFDSRSGTVVLSAVLRLISNRHFGPIINALREIV